MDKFELLRTLKAMRPHVAFTVMVALKSNFPPSYQLYEPQEGFIKFFNDLKSDNPIAIDWVNGIAKNTKDTFPASMDWIKLEEQIQAVQNEI